MNFLLTPLDSFSPGTFNSYLARVVLPKSILVKVFDYLSILDLASVSLTSVYGREVTNLTYEKRAKEYGYPFAAGAKHFLFTLVKIIRLLHAKRALPVGAEVFCRKSILHSEFDPEGTLLKLVHLPEKEIAFMYTTRELYEINHIQYLHFFLLKHLPLHRLEPPAPFLEYYQAGMYAAINRRDYYAVKVILENRNRGARYSKVAALDWKAEQEIRKLGDTMYLHRWKGEVDLGLLIGCNDLCLAASLGDVPIIELLVEYGYGVNCREHIMFGYLKTPLHQAVIYGNVAAVKFLLKKGANPMMSDLKGNRPIDYADPASAEIVALLK